MQRLKWFKWLKRILAAMIALPMAGLVVWYSMSFLPHLSELKSLSEQGLVIKNEANPAFYKLAVLGEGELMLRSNALRQSYRFLVSDRQQQKTFTVMLNNMLWLGASYLHFNDEKMFAIWVKCGFYGCDKGYPYLSQKFLNKPISELNVDELASLVVWSKTPSGYSHDSAFKKEQKAHILEQLKGQ